MGTVKHVLTRWSAYAVLALPLTLSGCLSVHHVTDDHNDLQAYGGLSELGRIGPCHELLTFGPLLYLDVPFSFAADTVMLPVTVPYEIVRAVSSERTGRQ